jgi:putative endonuclease
MTGRARTTGILGEELACQALSRRGYRVVARNWRCVVGEVDIIARDGESWVFVEVKTRRGRGSGLAEEALTPHKIERLSDLAETYLAEQGLQGVTWRIDLVAIELTPAGRIGQLRILQAVAD